MCRLSLYGVQLNHRRNSSDRSMHAVFFLILLASTTIEICSAATTCFEETGTPPTSRNVMQDVADIPTAAAKGGHASTLIAIRHVDGAVVGENFAIQPVIQVSDARFQASPTAMLITASLANPCARGGDLKGTTTVSASATTGIAAFTDLSIDGTSQSTVCTLQFHADDSSIEPISSSIFLVSHPKYEKEAETEKSLFVSCLYAKNTSETAEMYTQGLLQNAKDIKRYFPQWKLRVYHDDKQNANYLDELRSVGVELIDASHLLPHAWGDHIGMFWRIFAMADDKYDRFLFIDADSRLSRRQVEGIKEWIKSGFGAYAMRDSVWHSLHPLSGGMWGCKKGVKVDLHAAMDYWLRAYEADFLSDMEFLEKMIYPIIFEEAFSHDAISCEDYDLAVSWPTKRQWKDDRCECVGRKFFANNTQHDHYAEEEFTGSQVPFACRRQPHWLNG